MPIFDTHAHYDADRFDSDRDVLLSAMPEAGVGLVLDPGCDLPSSRAAAELAERYPHVYAAVGVHPEDCDGFQDGDLTELRQLLERPKVVAIGEIGLDYYWDKEPGVQARQRESFSRQLQLAKKLDKPVIIHSRDAAKDTLDVMAAEGGSQIRAVIHCFSYTKETARKFQKWDYYFGIGGVLTFKNAKAALNDLQWMTNNGVKLEGSEVTVSGNDGSGRCWLEKLTMDEDSKLVLKNVSQGISNYANVALEESLGAIRGFLPKGYSIANMKRNPADTDYRNTIADADGQIAQNVVLRYRKMTDADLSATLNPTTYTYDGTAKEPEVLVVYDGQTLTKDTDYTVAYSDNKNAGNAVGTFANSL